MRVDGVRRPFGQVEALAGLTFEVPEHSITVLLGPNGAGKTTAIRMITGALKPDGGSVRVFGLDPDVDGEEVRSRCGVVSAKPALYDRLSGFDNLAYSAELYGLGRGKKVADRIRAAADRFGIEHALDSQVGGYSTGMKTRLALARSILHEPDLLLFDEPTSGLDPESSHAVLELIREMTGDGRTVLMCTHLLLEAEGLADQIVVLEDGDDLVSGTPLRAHPPVLAARGRAPRRPRTPPPSTRARDIPGVRSSRRGDPAVVRARRRAPRPRPRRRAHCRRRAAHPGRAARSRRSRTSTSRCAPASDMSDDGGRQLVPTAARAFMS